MRIPAAHLHRGNIGAAFGRHQTCSGSEQPVDRGASASAAALHVASERLLGERRFEAPL